MNINQIDNIDRWCDSASVRKSCSFQVGKDDIGHETWARWRSLCRVKEKAKKLTLRESFLLLACSDLHRLKEPKINYVKIVNAANLRLETDPQSVEQLKVLTASTVKGSELPKVLKDLTGRSVTTRTLYRWGKKYKHMPKFCLSTEYSPIQLRLFLRHVDPNAA
jgi:hypothetical protein